MVMIAHLFNRTWDPENPATLSKRVITLMLRESLGFKGVVVSDDMQMGASHGRWELRASRGVD